MSVDAVSAAAASAATTKAKNSLSGNFDTFLRLLTTQLQYQDPLEPMDATKFTDQLVSYSQVEQQINTNANLENLLALSKAASDGNTVSYLGKTVVTTGRNTGLDGQALWRYALTSDAASVRLTITDVNGKEVFRTTGEKNVGRHEFAWDGKNAQGTQLPAGTYGLKVDAVDRDGTPLNTVVNGIGVVDEVDMSGTSPVVSVAGRVIGTSDILGFKN